jgi:hypothetical protein
MMLDSFDVDYIELETLMWQTGYLTIIKAQESYDGMEYTLAIPNQEVKISLLGSFADFMSKIPNSKHTKNGIYKALVACDLTSLEQYIKSLFASIAYNHFTGIKLYEFEGYYVSVFYAYLKSMGLELLLEDPTNKGRIDLTLKLPHTIYIIEFKVDATDALAQIKDKRYYEKYQSDGRDIYLVGIEFDTKDRNISKMEWERV